MAEPVTDIDEFEKKRRRMEELERERMRQDRAEGKAYADEVFSRPQEGLTQAQRVAMSERANKQIGRDVDNYNRMIRSASGAAGQRGGVVAAQQQALAQKGMAAQTDFQRDLSELDADLAMQKLAAKFGIEQGYAGEGALARQNAADYLTGREMIARNDQIARDLAAQQAQKKRKWWQIF